MSKWMHIAKTNEGFYVSGKLTEAITELDGYKIIDLVIKGTETIWLKLEKRK